MTGSCEAVSLSLALFSAPLAWLVRVAKRALSISEGCFRLLPARTLSRQGGLDRFHLVGFSSNPKEHS